MLEDKKVAIVYDWFDKWGGVERVLLTFHEMFPQADFYTSYFDKENAYWAKDFKIKTSFIQRLPKFMKRNRIISLPFYPFAFESFEFKDYKIVISITSSFAKAIITQPQTKHICYLLTPIRFLWSHEKVYFKNKLYKNLLNGYLNYLKDWDRTVAQRPDKIITISEAIKIRCEKYYNRESRVIYPPFDIEYWQNIKSKIQSVKSGFNSISNKLNSKYFLIVSRLEFYKNIDLVIKVFNNLNRQLVIVGKGRDENYLKNISNKNIMFLSNLKDEELAYLYSNAQALIMPQEEDFGYVSLEGQFFGCPVISYEKGGAKETIIDKRTGLFFNKQNEKSLGEAVDRFDKIRYNLKNITLKEGLLNIKKFSKKNFISRFKKII